MASTTASRNVSLGISLIMLAAGMAMLAYASVPLYRLFCQVTGFGGTTQEAERAPGEVLARSMTVHFNADVSPELPWKFNAVSTDMTFKIGEQQLAFFEATNMADEPLSGTSVFNVTPFKAGEYFMKIECFCYEEQWLNPNETVTLPVSFFIDPEIKNDPNLADVSNITLSYTFFKTKQPK